jgi:hypothetical protein
MYQAWQQGNEYYAEQWVDFVELVASQSIRKQDEIIRELQKYSWFQWTHDEK